MSEDDLIVPKVIDHNNLRISNLTIPLRMIGTVTNPEELVKEWNRLATKDFPLRDLAAFCYTADAGFFQLSDDILPEATKYRPPPLLSHLVNIIDLILRIQNIEGAALRINNLKQELGTLVSSAYKDGADHDKIEGIIIKTILSTYDEYLIGSHVFNIYPTIKFSPAAGPDYILDDICIRIESKSKLNRKYMGYGLDLNDLKKIRSIWMKKLV